MKKQMKIVNLLLALMVFPIVGLAQDKVNISNWPETAQEAAKAMMEKYGEPDEQVQSMLIWKNTGPFIKTIVYKDEVQHNFPMPHKDVLEQIINYDVPADMFDELARYDGSVIAERTKGTLAARCDKEGANYLALNLAHDIVEGKRNVDESRQYYADAIMRMMKGEKDSYLTGLKFEVSREDLTDPDETVLNMSQIKMMKKN